MPGPEIKYCGNNIGSDNNGVVNINRTIDSANNYYCKEWMGQHNIFRDQPKISLEEEAIKSLQQRHCSSRTPS